MFYTTFEQAIAGADHFTATTWGCYCVCRWKHGGFVIYSGWEDFSLYCTIKIKDQHATTRIGA